MKITFTMKTSDCLDYPAREYAKKCAIQHIIDTGYNGELEYYLEDKEKEFKAMMKKWFEYGELVTLEVDTELNTCTVVGN